MQQKIDRNRVTFDSAEFSGWVNGSMRNMPADFCGITQDTRKLKPGMLYVALQGENFDGHDFVGKAFDAGASAALVNASWKIPEALTGAPLIQVADTRGALLDAAHAWRELSPAKIVGITGSSGKTTTKEIASVLLSAGGGKVCCTEGNMNNDVGLPLSLLSMPPDCDYGIFEIGTNHPGEIAVLAEVLHPDFGLITSVGSAHIENFGSAEAIIREKGSLFSSIAPGGCAFISMDTSGFSVLKQMSNVPVFTVSMCNTEADFFGRILDEMQGRICVTECCSRKQTQLESRLPGVYNAANLLLAFALARIAGVSCEDSVKGLKNLSLPGMRWQRVECGNGIVVINDAYNANPESVKAVLNLFKGMTCAGRKIVVLGDMLELGEFAPEMHRDVGAAAAELNPDLLCLVGPLSTQYMSGGSVCKGYPQHKVFCFDDAVAAGRSLSKLIEADDLILLKASRGMKLEGVLDYLK